MRELTEKLTPLSDMALLMEIPRSELVLAVADTSNPLSRVYHETRARAALKIRERNIELAEAGSPTASVAVTNYLNLMANDEP